MNRVSYIILGAVAIAALGGGLLWRHLRSLEMAREARTLSQAQTDARSGNYDEARTLASTLRLQPGSRRAVDKKIARDIASDNAAWAAYARAASQYVAAARNIYNEGDGPPAALFDQLVSAAQKAVARPHEWLLSDVVLTKKLASMAKGTLCIEYSQPTPAAHLDYVVRVLSVSSWTPAFDPSSGNTVPNSTTDCFGSALINAAMVVEYRSNKDGQVPRSLVAMPADFVNDAVAAQDVALLPMPHGFALSFDGLITSFWGGSGDRYVLHVLRFVAGTKPKYDGGAIPKDVLVKHFHGLTGTGYAFPAGGDQEAPFWQCLACPDIASTATVKWNGDRYILTSTAIEYTAFAALVRYVETGSDDFVASGANFSALSYLRTLVNDEESRQTRCSMASDTSNTTSLNAIATVKISCPTVNGNVNISVKALRTLKVFKLLDAFIAPN
ncbi:MAG: hypothetical protein HKL91_02870 [Candidatus Eremiobacteraeota bacterium]|nr:hypothetical protein [Candidatus Eremiobacteraeota bacterium]